MVINIILLLDILLLLHLHLLGINRHLSVLSHVLLVGLLLLEGMHLGKLSFIQAAWTRDGSLWHLDIIREISKLVQIIKVLSSLQ